MGAAEVRGARSKGMITYIKHFAINDQDTNRKGLATFAPRAGRSRTVSHSV